MLLLSKSCQVASFIPQRQAEVITVDSKSCNDVAPVWPQPSPLPLLHQLTGPHAVGHLPPQGPVRIFVWNIQIFKEHSSPSYLHTNVTCSVRLSFLHSPIENCNSVPRPSTHFPALFLSTAPLPCRTLYIWS